MVSREVALDIESDNLLDNVTKIWCLSYRFVDTPDEVFTLTDYGGIREFFKEAEEKDYILICHNVIMYDLRVLKKILGITWCGKKIDTLLVSWYINHGRSKHGLEFYGEEFGVPKPVIKDWSTQKLEDYVYRCEQDTMIQVKTWLQLKGKLQELYND